MSEFNLIDEPWISVVTDYKGSTKLVGLKEFFENAHEYVSLAGDMPTQDFAVMRFILAILHTVFSRYDTSGNPYTMLTINDRMQQVENVYSEDQEEYEDALLGTWIKLWEGEKFPEIILEYLEKWHDRFFLFDDDYPFYQVTEKEVDPSNISKASLGDIFARNINRLISESGNKVALFSPKYSSNDNKDLMRFDEVARWLLTYQSYTGLADKVIFGTEKYKASKGWLFDLGGVYVSSDNLYKTLILNLILINKSNSQYNTSIQKPCWELSPAENVKKRMLSNSIDNIAELYTLWSRAIYIKEFDPNKAFKMGIVKLPDILHEDNFLEPMTIWKYNNSGDSKEKYTPRKHQLNKSLWRSFGLITKTEGANKENLNTPSRKPGIIEWLNYIDRYINNEFIHINSLSMEDNGSAMSWLPTNEIADSLCIEGEILNDLNDAGWIVRINNVVDSSKIIIDNTFKFFLSDIKRIRNLDSWSFVNNNIESLYYEIDKPFRDWLSSIDYNDNKDSKTKLWIDTLKSIIINQAKKIVRNSSPRDYTGISTEDKVENIATAFNAFMARINKL